MKRDRFLGKKRYIILFLLGAMVFLYPTLSNIYFDYKLLGSRDILKASLIAEEEQNKENPSEEDASAVIEQEFEDIQQDPEMKRLMSMELDLLKEYNNRLWESPGLMKEPFGEENGANFKHQIDEDEQGDSIFAYIHIEKLRLVLPIYLGTTDEHLNKGAAVIQGTAIPVGGEKIPTLL